MSGLERIPVYREFFYFLIHTIVYIQQLFLLTSRGHKVYVHVVCFVCNNYLRITICFLCYVCSACALNEGDTPSPLRTAYRSILALRTAYRHFWPRVLRTV